jgi:hypothetical protein
MVTGEGESVRPRVEDLNDENVEAYVVVELVDTMLSLSVLDIAMVASKGPSCLLGYRKSRKSFNAVKDPLYQERPHLKYKTLSLEGCAALLPAPLLPTAVLSLLAQHPTGTELAGSTSNSSFLGIAARQRQ